MLNPLRSLFDSQVEDVTLRLCKTEVSLRDTRPVYSCMYLPLEDTGIYCVYKLLSLKIIFYFTVYRAYPILTMLTHQHYTTYITYKEMYFKHKPVPLAYLHYLYYGSHYRYVCFLFGLKLKQKAFTGNGTFAVKIKATRNKTMAGLKKTFTIKESPQMFKSLYSSLWAV